MTTLQPVGTPHENIIMWDSTVASIPVGWLLCDGNNGTPDLRAEFILGVPTAGTNPGTTGGEDTHVLSTAEMPQHNHGIIDPTHHHRYGNFTDSRSGSGGGTTYNNSSLASISTGNTGDGDAHENRPAFYALVFIQRE